MRDNCTRSASSCSLTTKHEVEISSRTASSRIRNGRMREPISVPPVDVARRLAVIGLDADRWPHGDRVGVGLAVALHELVERQVDHVAVAGLGIDDHLARGLEHAFHASRGTGVRA